MSKIKANRLEPRTETGTLTIGNPTGATVFDGEVILPQYATLEHIEDIVAGDLAVELTNYQKMDEKNVPNGYAGLDANGKVPGNMLEDETKYDKVGGDISGTVRLTSPNRDLDILAGAAGSLRYDGEPKFRWGTSLNFSDQELDMQGHTVSNVAQPVSDNDAATKYYVDVNGGDFLQLSGGTMTGDIDMSGQRVKDIPQVPLEDTDAASKYYVDNASEVLNHNVEINGSLKVHSNYVDAYEVVFGVYEELSQAQAIEKGHDLSLGVPKEPRDGVPYSEYALFRVMGDGTLWGFNSLRGLSSPPGSDYDATNMEYVDNKLAGIAADFVDRIVMLEQKIAALESKL